MAINSQPFNDYNSMISYYAQQYGQSEDVIRDAFNRFKTEARRSADKNRILDTTKGYIKDYLQNSIKEKLKDTATEEAQNKIVEEGSQQAGESAGAGLGSALAYLQGARDIYGGSQGLEQAQKNGNEGIRSSMGQTMAGAGTILGTYLGGPLGGALGAGAGAAIGSGTGYVVDKFDGDPRVATISTMLGGPTVGVPVTYAAKKIFGLKSHKSDAQKRQIRHNALLKDENNSYKDFTEASNDTNRNAQIKANQDRAYAATPDGYVGWWDDPNTEGNEWTWVNKAQKPEHYKLDDEAYINTLGSGDIMFMPTFFENIPNWNELSMDQKDKIASKALELGKRNAGTKKGIYARAGEMDLGENLWKGELGDYAKRVMEGTDTEEERAMSNNNNNASGVNTSGNTSGFATLTYGQQGYPVGVVGNIFFPGDGSKPIYIGNYNKDKNISLANTLAKLKNDRQNAWGNVGKSFLAAYLGLDEDKKKGKDDDASLIDYAKLLGTNKSNSVLDLLGSGNSSAPASIDDLFTTPDFDYRYL